MYVGHLQSVDMYVGHLQSVYMYVGHLQSVYMYVGHLQSVDMYVGHLQSVDMYVGHLHPKCSFFFTCLRTDFTCLTRKDRPLATVTCNNGTTNSAHYSSRFLPIQTTIFTLLICCNVFLKFVET
jgi:hypothetical protein